MDTITTWLKNNPLIAGLIAIGAILLFFPKIFKSIFGGSTRVRHRRVKRVVRSVNSHRRRVHHAITGSHKRRSPRIRRRSKGAKKPWQVKGSLAARRHMALIRKRR
jgi:hypothetical protein